MTDDELSDLLATALSSRSGTNRAIARLRANEVVKVLREHHIGFFRHAPLPERTQIRLATSEGERQDARSPACRSRTAA